MTRIDAMRIGCKVLSPRGRVRAHRAAILARHGAHARWRVAGLFLTAMPALLTGGPAAAQMACEDAWRAFVVRFPDDATPPPYEGTIAADWFRYRSAAADFAVVADLVKSAKPEEVDTSNDARFVAEALVLTDRLVACYPPHVGSVAQHAILSRQFEAEYPPRMRKRLIQTFAGALRK